MIGAIIGDIVGSRFEFFNTDKYDFELFTKDCSFTDDTVCTVAVADAILRGVSFKDSLLHWCAKYPNPMGAYGGSFNAWLHSSMHEPYNSFGNGAAMRVSPVGWAFNSGAETIRQAVETAKITHSHTEGLIGATAVAMCIYELRDKGDNHDFAEIASIARWYYGNDWDKNLPPRGFFDETCQGCVPLAFDIVIKSDSFEDAIRKAVSYGGDSDTLGAIVGSIAEARFGVPAELEQCALSYLPDEMKSVITKFRSVYET